MKGNRSGGYRGRGHRSSEVFGLWVLFGFASAIGWAQPPPADFGAPIEIGSSHLLTSEVLDQTRRVNVYLPPGYADSQSSYPVLYLLDGGIEEDFLHIAGIASLAADFRRIRPFIVVGIEGIDRYHDLTAPTSVPEEKERLPSNGGAAAFRAFLAQELVPFVWARFRVTAESVLIGESIAGLFVVETLLRQPDLFTGYVAVSPSLWWDRGSLAEGAAKLLDEPFPAPPRRLYLTIGDEGGAMREAVDQLVAALQPHASTVVVDFRPMANESHGTIFHPAALAAIRQLFGMPE